MPFFVGSNLTTYEFRPNGTSISTDTDNVHYTGLARDYIRDTYQNTLALNYSNKSVGGTNTWYRLVCLPVDVLATPPNLVVFDSTNDVDIAPHKKIAEAYIRRVRDNCAGVKMIFLSFPYVTGGAPTVSVQQQWWMDLAADYGLPVINVTQAFIDSIAAGDDTIDTLYNAPDYVHPSQRGQLVAYNTLLPTLITTMAGAAPGALPARQYDDGSYENAPTIRTGVDNDGETGTGWGTVNTTQRQSSTAGDTISYNVTSISWGLDANYGAGAGVFEWTVDGGGSWHEVDLSTWGVANTPVDYEASRAARTVTIRVKSGTVRVNRFLAV